MGRPPDGCRAPAVNTLAPVFERGSGEDPTGTSGQHGLDRHSGDAVMAAAAVRQARAAAQLDALVDASPIGIGFWDTDLRYQRVNDALAELNGCPAADHIGKTPADVMGDMGERVMECLAHARDTRRPVHDVELTGTVLGRTDMQHREGSWFPVFGDDGEVIGLGGVVRDVTARHEAEAERNRLLEAAITVRAHAEAAQVRALTLQEEAERSRLAAESARREAEDARRAAERAQRRMRFLVDVSTRMAESMDLDDTLEQLARAAVPTLADFCMIATVGPRGRLSTAAVAHVDAAVADRAFDLYRRYPPRQDSPHGPGRVIRTGERQVIPELTDEILQAQARDEDHLALLRSLDIGSAVVLPLRASDVVVGALTLATRTSGRRFGDEEVTLAQALADQAALHLRNAQLYTERSHVAQTLQASLRPQELPDVPGVEIAARYQPAGAHNEVGGDFYDVFHAEDDVWIALLGDVAGKGAEAAAVTSLARHTLRTSALHAISPAANLHTLNRALLGEASTTRFCTVLYARICPSADSVMLTIANGGHLAPRVLRAGQPLERLEVSGTLVGAIDDAHFEEVDLRLEPGNLILMYTDGVTEVRRRGLGPDYGEAELDRTLAAMAGATADEVVQALLERAIDMHGGEPRDDMALVAMRIRER